jgi:hypothetical protein
METSLHRQLKYHFATDAENVEVTVEGFRIDAIDHEGCLVEVQHSALGSIRNKCSKLLESGYYLRVIKPWIQCKWIETYDKRDGNLLRRRKSPKKLRSVDIFRELIHFTNVFPHPQLTLEILLVDCVEKRVDQPNRRRRRKQYQVLDQSLVNVHESDFLRTTDDLWRLIGAPSFEGPFDTHQLALAIDQPRWFAQQIAYTLQRCDATRRVGKRGNSILYESNFASDKSKAARRQSA